MKGSVDIFKEKIESKKLISYKAYREKIWESNINLIILILVNVFNTRIMHDDRIYRKNEKWF